MIKNAIQLFESKVKSFLPNRDFNKARPTLLIGLFAAVGTILLFTSCAATAQIGTSDVKMVVQIGEGGGIPADLVASGKWQARVQELVNHYKPWVHAWEAWNEPNNTYGGGVRPGTAMKYWSLL